MPLRLSCSVVADWSWPIWLIWASSSPFLAGSIGSWFWSWVIIILMKSSLLSSMFFDFTVLGGVVDVIALVFISPPFGERRGGGFRNRKIGRASCRERV